MSVPLVHGQFVTEANDATGGCMRPSLRSLFGLALCIGVLGSPVTASAQSLEASAPAVTEGKILDVAFEGIRNVEEAVRSP